MAHQVTQLSSAELGTLLDEIHRDPSAGISRIRTLPIEHLIQLFGTFRSDPPGQESDLRSLAYLSLSTIISAVRAPLRSTEPPSEQQRNTSTQTLVSAFTPALDDALQGTSIDPVLSALAFLVALFQVDPDSAIAIVQRDGMIDSVLDALDVFPAQGSPGAQGTDLRVARAMAALLSQAAGHRTSRSLLKNAQDARCIRWLRGNISLSDLVVRATSALALIKLAKGGLQDTEAQYNANMGGEDEDAGEDNERALVRLMQGVVLDESSQLDFESPAVVGAIEGLAYLSTEPSIKETIFEDDQLVKRLIALGLAITPSNKKNLQPKIDPRLGIGLHYGIAVIIHNLCVYRPKLSGEEEQVARLKRMAKAPLTNESKSKARLGEVKEDPRDSDGAVRKRIDGLLKAGILPVLSGLARSESAATRAVTGRIYLSVVEDQANRGAVLQNGGTKALMHIIISSSKPGTEPTPDYISIQALSKLAITAAPVQVFGPDPGAVYDAIGPLISVLLASPSSLESTSSLTSGPNNLQRFESLMALTNIASTGAASAARIAATPKLFPALDMLLLDDHPLLRRAATELVCDLVVCDEGFERFIPYPASSPASPSSPTTPSIAVTPPKPKRRTTKGAAENRLRILLALSDVEDLPTRRAASGALAMLTSDDAICGVIVGMERKKGNAIAILGRLLVGDEEVEESEIRVGKGKGKAEGTPSSLPDLALAHRGIVCLRNLVKLGFAKGGPVLLQAFEREGVIEKVEAIVKFVMESGEGKTGGQPSSVVQAAVEFVLGLKTLVNQETSL